MTGRFTTGPADYLAAERTFLAWIRTGLALMGFGFVVACFGLLLEPLQIGQPNLELRSVGLSPWFRHSSRLSRLQRFERQYALAYRRHIRVETTGMSRRLTSPGAISCCSGIPEAIGGSQS